MNIPPETSIDGYKADHRRQYPKNTATVVSNLTARGTRRGKEFEEVMFFGLQYFLKEYLIRQWNENFFSRPKEEVLARFTRRINSYLGKNQIGTEHIAALHDLGYLPISIYALPEGSVYKLRIPCLVIFNTLKEFFWVTNYLETILSAIIWGPCTSATTALYYRRLLNKFALETVGNTDFVPFQGHDFSFRGMFGMEAALMSGGAHLISFKGTDTIPAIDWLEQYYNADCTKEFIGGSVSATEHSVACSLILDFVNKVRIENAGTPGQVVVEDDLMALADVEYVKYLITEVYPTGIISIVADSFDYWNTITNTARILKDAIMSRDGKVVFRPDTGDPVKVVCGYTVYDVPEFPSSFDVRESKKYDFALINGKLTDGQNWNPSNINVTDAELKGSIECLWDIFGGTTTPKGYRLLDSHVGLIYGDSITLERGLLILDGLKRKGFCSINIVLGIGSYTYQYVTRDTDGYAVKATFLELSTPDSDTLTGVNIFKKPKTGDGVKNSAVGLVAVYQDKDGEFSFKDRATWEELKNCALDHVFCDSKLLVDRTVIEIRERAETNF